MRAAGLAVEGPRSLMDGQPEPLWQVPIALFLGFWVLAVHFTGVPVRRGRAL